MNGIELSEELPKSYLEKASKMGVHEKELRGGLKSPYRSQKEDIRTEAERVVNYIKGTVFPKVLHPS